MNPNKTDIIDFEQILKEHHTMVFRTAMGFVHVREDAEDVTQEVFIRAYQSIGKFRGESGVSTWLYRIAVNLSLNFVSQKQRRGFLQLGEDMLKSLYNRAGNAKNPHQELESTEEKAIIRTAIDSLPEKQRTAFILTRYDDLSQKEVAEIMQISQRAVEQLLLRAKNNLSKKLEPPIRKQK